MNHRNAAEDSPTVRQLLREHGPLLSAAATAKLLGFSNTDALRQARLQQRLPVRMFAIQGRRGWFASTSAVGDWLERIIDGANSSATQSDDSAEMVAASTPPPRIVSEANTGSRTEHPKFPGGRAMT